MSTLVFGSEPKALFAHPQIHPQADLDSFREIFGLGPARTDSYAQTVETVSWLLRDAVKRQLVSDVPVCSFLSGGIDSSVVTAIASRHMVAEQPGGQQGKGRLELHSLTGAIQWRMLNYKGTVLPSHRKTSQEKGVIP